MTQNIEERTLAATATLEGAAKAVDEIANTDKDVSTPVGSRKSFPKISREWEEESTRLKDEWGSESQRLQTEWNNDSATLRQNWQNERNELSTKALGVKPWESGVSETNINQQRRWDDGHTYLPKTVPAVMDAGGPDDSWIPYTADKSDTLNDVFGRKPVDLIEGLVLVPDQNSSYPKMYANGVLWEIKDNDVQYTVASFSSSGNDYLIINMEDLSQIVATKLISASREFVKDKVDHVDKIYSRNFKSVVDLMSGVSADGRAVNYNDMIGQRVEWRGYYNESDGGSNWGVVKQGAHISDGGSVFSLGEDIYVQANFGKKVSIEKFGAKPEKDFDNLTHIQNAFYFARSTKRKFSGGEGTFEVSGQLDFRSHNLISLKGLIYSKIASGVAAMIGYTGFANINSQPKAEILLKLSGISNSFETEAIQIHGLRSSKDVHLSTEYFKKGVRVFCQKDEYCAYNTISIKTYACPEALVIDDEEGGWCNENRWYLELSGASIPPEVVSKGISLIGSYGGNNHVFYKPSIEGFDVPIDIQNGYANSFEMIRAEESGAIVLGEHAAANIITMLYPYGLTFDGHVIDNSKYVNFVNRVGEVIETDIAKITKEDFVHYSNTDGRNYFSPKCQSKNYGSYFEYLTHTDDGFKVLSNDSGYVDLPVNQNDTFYVYFDANLDIINTGELIARIDCLDANGALLTNITEGVPYIGSDRRSVQYGTSDQSPSMEYRKQATELVSVPMTHIKINRPEVKFIRLVLCSQVEYYGVYVKGIKVGSHVPNCSKDLMSKTNMKWLSSTDSSVCPVDHQFQKGFTMNPFKLYLGCFDQWYEIPVAAV